MLDMLKAMVRGTATPRRHSPGYTPPGKAAAPKPKPTPASREEPRPRAAPQEVVPWRELGRTIHETHQHTNEALSLLHDLATPPTSEKPSQIEDILTALTAILESQRQLEIRQERMEQQLERIFNMLRPRAA